jgi:hypothetical protein
MHDRRVVELPYSGEKVKSAALDCPSVMIVPFGAAQEEPGIQVDAPELVPVPELPMIVMPMFEGTVTPLVHVQAPAGI